MKKLLSIALLLLTAQQCFSMEKNTRTHQEISDDLQLALVSLLSLDDQLELLIERAYKVLLTKEHVHPLIQQAQALLQEYTTQSERTSKFIQELHQNLQVVQNLRQTTALTELLSKSEAELQLRERHVIIHVNALEQLKDDSAYQDKKVECPVCLAEVYENETLTLSCSHRYCLPCLKRLVDIALKDKDVLQNLICKINDCNRLFSFQDLKNIVQNPTQLQQLENIATEQVVAKDAHGKHCPNPQCTYIYFDERNEGPRSTTCPKCKHVYCSRCFKNHLTTIKCEDAGLEEWRKKNNAKPCPKCTALIQKDGGCNIMTCKKCQHGFCWICLQPRGHHRRACHCPLNS